MKARLFQARLGGDGFWRGDGRPSSTGVVVVGSKGGLPSWRYGGVVNSRVLGFAAALDAVGVFFLKLISYRYHILATSRTRCYYALAKITKGVA